MLADPHAESDKTAQHQPRARGKRNRIDRDKRTAIVEGITYRRVSRYPGSTKVRFIDSCNALEIDLQRVGLSGCQLTWGYDVCA